MCVTVGSVSTPGNTWGTGNRMIYYDEVNCGGDENSLSECSKTSIDIIDDASEWYDYERAGVSCNDKAVAGKHQASVAIIILI